MSHFDVCLILCIRTTPLSYHLCIPCYSVSGMKGGRGHYVGHRDFLLLMYIKNGTYRSSTFINNVHIKSNLYTVH